MTISIAEPRPLRFPACGHTGSALFWLALDVVERPDLRAAFADGAAYFASCPRCGEEGLRDLALLIVRLGATAPLVLACPDSHLKLPDPTAPSRAVVERVAEAVRAQGLSIPGPILIVPYDVAITALSRDVDRDAADPQAALGDLGAADAEMAERYAIFLNDVIGSTAERRVNAALDELVDVASEAELRAVMDRHPVLRSPEARAPRAQVAATSADEEERRFAAGQVALLERCAAGDVRGAWAAYEVVMVGVANDFVRPQLARLMAAFDNTIDRDKAQAAHIGEELVAKTRQIEAIEMEAVACARTASAYYEMRDGDRAGNVERAVTLLERAREIHAAEPEIGDDDQRVEVLLNLGAAVGARYVGDPVANQERAIALQREVLDHVSEEDDARTWAMAHTNLGLNLLERDRALLSAIDDKDEVSGARDLAEAIDHFEQALRWRSFERDPLDWAFTRVNLGLAYKRGLGGDRRSELQRAVEHTGEAVRGFEAAGQAHHQAQALGNCASARTDLALLPETPADERAQLVATAEREARAAVQLQGPGAGGIEGGRRWWQLARALTGGNRYTPEAVEAYREALRELAPQRAPRECRDAARELAELADRNDDLPVAAEAWEVAALGAAAAVETRATRDGRFAEIHENVNVFRWAAYALVRVGMIGRAVEILELGRGRELASWLQRDIVDLEPLRHLNPQLCDEFLELGHQIEVQERNSLARSDLEAAAAIEALAATVAQIRRLPGLEGFLQRPKLGDLAAAAPQGEAVAYPVTSPYGSAWLVVRGDGEPQVTAIDLPSLTSTAVLESLLRADLDTGTVTGYLAAQANHDLDLDAEIQRAAALLGPELLRPLGRELSAAGVHSVCIVPIGLLGLVPLHALPWDEDDAARCLLDIVDVTYAPSAYVRLVCRERAATRGGFTRLVTVGNPLPQADPLPNSEYEAAIVARTMPAEASDVFIGEAATREAVLAALPGASHVHLACHGRAAAAPQALDAVLSFAHDRVVSAAELLDVDLSTARLVVASACETGVIPGYEAADESLALSTVLIGAGAAGVIASLWAVDDYATSLLMTRFYEELVPTPDAPAQALRVAQLWLRNLTPDDEQRYVERHPVLREQRARRQDAPHGGRGAPVRAHVGDARFAALTAWAGFVFSGG